MRPDLRKKLLISSMASDVKSNDTKNPLVRFSRAIMASNESISGRPALSFCFTWTGYHWSIKFSAPSGVFGALETGKIRPSIPMSPTCALFPIPPSAMTAQFSNSNVKEAPPGLGKKPEGLDWDRWLGRGPKVGWNPDIYFSPYKWLYYDGGMIMGIGIHVIDNARHWLSVKKPASVVCGGGTYFYKDGRDTPDVVTAVLDYPEEVTLTFTAECLTAPGVKTSAGVELRGTGGTLSANRYDPYAGYEYVPNSKFSKEPEAKVPMKATNAERILPNWLECIRDRKKTVANEEEGYYSAVACFMANQAFRTKTRIAWNNAWDLPA